MPLSQDYIDEIKRILESISCNLRDYSPRHSQKRMIAAVAEVLSRANELPEPKGGEEIAYPENTGCSILCVQGPTGVGKSLGYLIGGVVAARAKKRKLVISSATVALQEQLVSRDVPFFIKNSGLPLTFSIAKGRTRYVCHHKLAIVVMGNAQDELFDLGALWEHKPEEAEVRRLGELLASFESGKWSGDRDELHEPISDGLWSRVTTDRHGCLNRNCKSYYACAQMNARKRIREVDIIIANHDLLLSDMAMGGGVVLPDPEEAFYILDEGHHIASKAVESFSGRHQVRAAQAVMEKLAQAVVRIGQTYSGLSALSAKVVGDAEDLAGSMADVFRMLDGIDKAVFDGNGNLWRFEGNQLPVGTETLVANILGSAGNLEGNLTRLLDELSEMKKEASGDVRLDKFLSDMGFFFGRVETIHKTWVMLSMPCSSNPADTPVAKWVVYESKKGMRHDFSICACPVSAASALSEMFFKRAGGVVLTSATLMSMGNFDQLLRETGLECLPDTSLLALPSPFNFAEQGVLSIPDLKASPKDAARHTRAIIECIPGLIEQTGNAGTLVLFASRRQMTEVANNLPKLRDKMLIQGERPKTALIEEHRRRIDDGQPSVLFGLQSFAEGMDLPGKYCAHVVITKIPFAVPSDPVQQTLEEWLSKMHKSYFDEIALPQACLRMVQWAGRLIRTERDKGILTVLDERLKKTGYGRKIRESLPPFRMVA